MLHLVISFALGSGAACVQEGLPAAPMDLAVGQQTVELRKPLIARSSGARLVLFVRELSQPNGEDVREQFRADAPHGSVTAVLTAADGNQMKLMHTGYSFYKGYKGLLLTAAGSNIEITPKMYGQLEIDSSVALADVRVVWLDRDVVNVRDIHPRF